MKSIWILIQTNYWKLLWAVGMLNTVYLIVLNNYYQMLPVLEKEMAIYSNILAWRIPRTEELGRLQTIGSQRIGHDWVSMYACVRCDNVISVMFFLKTHLLEIHTEIFMDEMVWCLEFASKLYGRKEFSGM